MILIVCVDDSQGMLFNGRRQSRDRKLSDFLMSVFDTISCSAYSAELFRNYEARVNVRSWPEQTDVWFCESSDYVRYDHIEEIVICRWNRIYPCDVKFSMNMSDYKKTEEYEFIGNSHDRICVEILKGISNESK